MTTSDNQADMRVKVFFIVGFGGLGKTTLAEEVRRNLKEEFTCQAIVSVSQAFHASKDMDGLLGRIHQQVIMEKKEEIASTTTLNQDLKEKRYLIVIDDVWTISDCDAIRSKLPENNNSSRIIVTTRIESVAKTCIPTSAWGHYIHRVEPLKPEDSKRLFIDRVFGQSSLGQSQVPTRAPGVVELTITGVKTLLYHSVSGALLSKIVPWVFGHVPRTEAGLLIDLAPSQASVCPEELREAMDEILRKCGGLPLAIVSIASLLASYYKSPRRSDMWRRICNSIAGSQMESNPTLEGMRQLIALSYNHLPHHLKPCVMYLSIFPEDYMVNKERLFNRWIAEGLIPEKRRLTLQEVAEDYFEELLSRNMIKPGGVTYDDDVTECSVHDMMLEVIVSKALEANFVSLVGGLCGGTSYDTVRRLSIQGELLDSSSSVEEMSFRHVRSLSSFCPEIKGNLLDRRLPEFTLLRVLDLQGCKEMRNHHLKHICRMFLLRFLNLNDTDITELPTEIGELRHLQTLWLHDTLLDRVPESLIHLEKLEDLSFWNRNDWDKYASLPLGLRKMKALRVMPRQELHEGDAELAKEVGDLVQLQKININLQCTDCWDKPVLKELGISIGKLRSLRELGIEDMKLTYANNLRFLEHLPSPPQLLRKLKIGGQMDRIPHWVESLTHLVSIEFWWINMPGDEIYGVLHKLPNLLRISLDRGCCNEEELVARTTSVFPVLKVLEFHRNELPKVIRFEKQSMENLTRLRVCFGDEHRRLTGVENLIRLQEVVLVGKENITALHDAMDQMKTESQSREESKQFKIIVTYMSD
uniref:Uncharacterized protein n=1 Tax=Avena sativa TaxID=4498 RepID=A0ACD5YZK6_AVESA